MTHYILCGKNAIENFEQQNWNLLELDILKLNKGELISFETSEFKNGIGELLNSLKRWSDFIELSENDLKEISSNTKIKIFIPLQTIDCIYWSTKDFELIAEKNFCELKEENFEEFKHLKSWDQLYDKTKFAQELKDMIRLHNAEIGITWLTIEEHLGNCEIK